MGSPVVLLVEDDEDTRATVEIFLREEGYDVALATNGEEALARLQRAPAPGLVLLDLMMPKMNGYELLQAIAKSPNLSEIPLVVYTASPTSDTGALAYPVLRKPIDLDVLLSTVMRYCPRTVAEHEPQA